MPLSVVDLLATHFTLYMWGGMWLPCTVHATPTRITTCVLESEVQEGPTMV